MNGFILNKHNVLFKYKYHMPILMAQIAHYYHSVFLKSLTLRRNVKI